MAGKYYVHVQKDDTAYGPYALKSAKDFARIGSQHGSARAVTRGLEGPRVRLYIGGKRRWPTAARQCRGLTAGERPRTLAVRNAVGTKGLPLIEHKKVFHVGAEPTGAMPKRSAMSYEGPGLSVSIHPELWRRIARLGDAPVWELRRADGAKGQFVDMKKLLHDQELVSAMLIRAHAQGLVERTVAYRLTYRDGETGRKAYMDFPTEVRALAEQEEFGGKITSVEASRALPALHQWWGGYFTQDVPAAFAREAAIIAVMHDSGVDGLWWPDRLDALHLSAPRGVIFPHALGKWHATPVALQRNPRGGLQQVLVMSGSRRGRLLLVPKGQDPDDPDFWAEVSLGDLPLKQHERVRIARGGAVMGVVDGEWFDEQVEVTLARAGIGTEGWN